MKKSNMITLVAIVAIIIALVLVIVIRKGKENKPEPTTAPVQTTEPSVAPTPTPTPVPFTMDDALFVGDSRTVGIEEYGQIEGADFFCNVGMSVYNIDEGQLSSMLAAKSYGKIYIMLGINEVGYDKDTTAETFGDLVNSIRQQQPNAKIIIMANLHVTASRSNSDSVVNNTQIDALNSRLAKLADGKNVYYLDVNTVFDDEYGNLKDEMSGESTHLYAKYYAEWGNWIVEQSKTLIK